MSAPDVRAMSRHALEGIGNDVSKVSDASANLDVILRAMGHISERAYDYAIGPYGNPQAAAGALELLTGLGAIAQEELRRGDIARLEADNAIFDLKQALS